MTVTEDDRPIATLAPISPAPPAKRVTGLWKGQVTILADDDDHLADFAGYMSS